MEAFIQFLIDWGYWGLFLAAFIAGSVIPLTSELVLVVLVHMGLSPVWCVAIATIANTLGGMTCYWIGTLGNMKWIERLGVSEAQLERARRFLAGRGALMAFFIVLPFIGEAIAVLLGLMRSNMWITCLAMFVGKLIRYIAVVLALQGAVSLFS